MKEIQVTQNKCTIFSLKLNSRLEIEHASCSADLQDTVIQMNALLEIRIKNADRLIFGHLNKNSLRNKFEMLEKIIKDNSPGTDVPSI